METTTSSQAHPASDIANCHYRSLHERRLSKQVRCDSSPVTDVVALTTVPSRHRITGPQTSSPVDEPSTSPPPTPVTTTATTTRKLNSRKSVSSKFLARFMRKNTGQMSFAKSTVQKEKVERNGPFPDCDSGCLQASLDFEVRCFLIVSIHYIIVEKHINLVFEQRRTSGSAAGLTNRHRKKLGIYT